jgi:hypothetical protein
VFEFSQLQGERSIGDLRIVAKIDAAGNVGTARFESYAGEAKGSGKFLSLAILSGEGCNDAGTACVVANGAILEVGANLSQLLNGADGRFKGVKITTPEDSVVGTFAITAVANTFDGGCLADADVFGKVPNCTSNDISLTAVKPESCTFINNCVTDPNDPGYPGTVTLQGCIGLFQITSVQRYDIGLFIRTDIDPGDSFPNNDAAKFSGECTAIAWDTSSPLNDGPNGSGTDGDACGDVNAQGQTIELPIPDVTIACVDTNGDNQVDIFHCETWANGATQITCNSAEDVTPGTSAHCNCGILAGACIPFPSTDECKENVCALRCSNAPATPCTLGGGECTSPGVCQDTLVTQDKADGTTCGDGGDQCTGLKTCQAGVCETGSPLDCDDGSACTTDGCDPATGCTHTAVDCNDSDACTTDGCAPATGCTHTAVDCNDGSACTTDTCNPASGCVYTPITCNDGSACTTDTCNPATGCVYTSITCDDGNACTADTCDPSSGCVFTPISCNEGCTPGFWKAPQHFQSWCGGYTPNTPVSTVFDTTDCGCNFSSLTFRQALSGKGGTTICAAQAKLFQAAVAALLNACSVNYPLSTAQIIAEVNAALASCDKSTILAEASRLDGFNNLGASICQ